MAMPKNQFGHVESEYDGCLSLMTVCFTIVPLSTLIWGIRLVACWFTHPPPRARAVPTSKSPCKPSRHNRLSA